MNLIDNFHNLMDKAKKLNVEQIKNWKTTLIVFICIDIFGIYWFLKLKGLGIAIMMFLIIALAFLLWLEGNLPGRKRKPEKTPPKDKGAFNLYNLQESIKGGGWV